MKNLYRGALQPYLTNMQNTFLKIHKSSNMVQLIYAMFIFGGISQIFGALSPEIIASLNFSSTDVTLIVNAGGIGAAIGAAYVSFSTRSSQQYSIILIPILLIGLGLMAQTNSVYIFSLARLCCTKRASERS